MSLELRVDVPLAALLAHAGLVGEVTICCASALRSVGSFKEIMLVLQGTIVLNPGCSALLVHSSPLSSLRRQQSCVAFNCGYSLMGTDACEGIRKHPRPTCIAVRPHHACVSADHHTCTAFTAIADGMRTDVFVSAERSSGGTERCRGLWDGSGTRGIRGRIANTYNT